MDKQQKAIIVYAHPYNRSFASAVLESAKEGLAAANKPFEVIDLHVDQFNPVMTERELIESNYGQIIDPLVKKYAEMMKSATELVIIYPDWWSGMPATMKGFFDKTFVGVHNWKPGTKHEYLANVERVNVFSTSFTPHLIARLMLGNAAETGAVKGTFKAMGVENVKFHILDRIGTSELKRRQAHLEAVKNICAGEGK